MQALRDSEWSYCRNTYMPCCSVWFRLCLQSDLVSANIPRRQRMMAQTTEFLSSAWETQMKFQTPVFTLAVVATYGGKVGKEHSSLLYSLVLCFPPLPSCTWLSLYLKRMSYFPPVHLFYVTPFTLSASNVSFILIRKPELYTANDSILNKFIVNLWP